MDAVEPQLMIAVRSALNSTQGVRSVTSLRLRWVGHDLFAEANLTANDTLTMTQAHDIAHRAEDSLGAALPRLAEATMHVSPVREG